MWFYIDCLGATWGNSKYNNSIKINKNKKLNKLVDRILEQCCSFIGVDYNLVDIHKCEMALAIKLIYFFLIKQMKFFYIFS